MNSMSFLQMSRFSRSNANRLEAYRGLFKAQIDDDAMNEIRSATNGNYVLGSVRFQQEIERVLGRRVVKGNAGRRKKRNYIG
jgi:putative transposase